MCNNWRLILPKLENCTPPTIFYYFSTQLTCISSSTFCSELWSTKTKVTHYFNQAKSFSKHSNCTRFWAKTPSLPRIITGLKTFIPPSNKKWISSTKINSIKASKTSFIKYSITNETNPKLTIKFKLYTTIKMPVSLYRAYLLTFLCFSYYGRNHL